MDRVVTLHDVQTLKTIGRYTGKDVRSAALKAATVHPKLFTLLMGYKTPSGKKQFKVYNNLGAKKMGKGKTIKLGNKTVTFKAQPRVKYAALLSNNQELMDFRNGFRNGCRATKK